MSNDPIDQIIAVAAASPDARAIHTDHASWSYADLMVHMRAYAAVFAAHDAPRVAVVLPQENNAYACFLGAGLAGGYYSPLNVATPLEKLGKIMTRLRPDFIVAETDLLADLMGFAPEAVAVDPATLDLAQQFAGNGTRHDWAYVNFTSGSTGEPKGVVVPRAGLINYVDWVNTLGITPEDRVSQQPNLAFDISQTDIYGALCAGATLYPVYDEADKMMPGHFIRKHQITIWNSTPSAISQMMRGRQLTTEKFGSVRLVNFCGEALFPEQVEAVFAAMASGDAYNFPVVREAIGHADALYGFKGGFDRSGLSLGLKAGGYWPGNMDKGLTNHQSTVFLFDPDTGMVRAMVGGNLLTALRTAAASSVSIKHLARDDAKTLGMVGAGHQATFQLRAALEQRSFEKVIGWNYHPEMLPNIEKVATEAGVPF